MSDLAVQIKSTLSAESHIGSERRHRPAWLSSDVIASSIRISYSLLLTLSALAAQGYTNGSAATINILQTLLIALSAVAALYMPTPQLPNRAAYATQQYLFKLVAYMLLLYAAIATIVFVTSISYDVPIDWILAWFCFGASALLLLGAVCSTMLMQLRRNGLLAITTVIIGSGDTYNYLLAAFRRQSNDNVQLIGTFDVSRNTAAPNTSTAQEPDDREYIVSIARSNEVDQIIVALPWYTDTSLQTWLKPLISLPSSVLLCPPTFSSSSTVTAIPNMYQIPLLEISKRPITGWHYILKVTEDRLLGITLLCLASPLMLAIAMLIKLDSEGPVLFRQTRYGYNNSLFQVLKFRTMQVAEPTDDCDQISQATRFDCRVTRIGRWLRRTSLDELPQLLNVIRGEMSLVGPRPHAVAHHKKYQTIVDAYAARHRVKPGITGWAQVNGYRGETDVDEKMVRRVEHDLYYIAHWSLYLDLAILVRTVRFGFIHPNAY